MKFLSSAATVCILVSQAVQATTSDAMDPSNVGLAATFVSIPAGEFVMGSPENEDGRDFEEIQHKVTLTQGFDLQVTHVTQYQYMLVTAQNPSFFTTAATCPGEHRVVSGVEMCPNHPVERVSWEDAQAFVAALNNSSSQYVYRLPTSAEWEYAVRAGSLTAYFFGTDGEVSDDYAWFSANAGDQTHGFALKKIHPYGMYDMIGNVWQWMSDWVGPYTSDTQTDPQGPTSGSQRVLRGGAWYNSQQNLRSAKTYGMLPSYRDNGIGFRLIRRAK